MPSAAPEGSDAVTRAAIALEFSSLRYKEHCPMGMYVSPSTSNFFLWHGVLFVHQGYYSGLILKFQITFPNDYPEHPPAVHFSNDVFHPLVHPTSGLFKLPLRLQSWKPKEHHIFDVLHWIKASFKRQALESITEADCLNIEAYRYRDGTGSFAALATQSSKLSQSPQALFDRQRTAKGKDLGGINFRQLDQDALASLRSKLGLQNWEKDDWEKNNDV